MGNESFTHVAQLAQFQLYFDNVDVSAVLSKKKSLYLRCYCIE